MRDPKEDLDMEIASTSLTSKQQGAYQDLGYHFPVRAFEDDEAARWRNTFISYHEQHSECLQKLLPRERRSFASETHFFLRWVHEIVSHPRVLDAVECVIGPDIMVWSSQWFPKFPKDKAFVSWHQ